MESGVVGFVEGRDGGVVAGSLGTARSFSSPPVLYFWTRHFPPPSAPASRVYFLEKMPLLDVLKLVTIEPHSYDVALPVQLQPWFCL